MSYPLDYPTYMERCYDCELTFYKRADFKAHMATHVERPHDDALTVSEVAKALGKKRGTVQGWVKSGRLPSIRLERGNVRTWVMRKSLKSFVRSLLEEEPWRAKDWVEGKGL